MRSDELVALLAHSVGWWRETAQRLLVEREDKSVVPLLREQLRRSPTALGRSHSLWTLSGLDALTGTDVMAGLADPDWAVRRQAVRSFGQRPIDNPSAIKAIRGMSREKNDELRFQLALSARQLPVDDAMSLIVDLLSMEPSREIQLAILCSSTAVQPRLILKTLVATEAWSKSPRDWQITLLEQLAEQMAQRPPDQTRPFAEWLTNQARSSVDLSAIAIVNGLARGLESRGTSLVQSASTPDSNWNLLEPSLSAYGDAAVNIATNLTASVESRRVAIDLLGRSQGEQSKVLLDLLNGSTERAIQSATARAIANRQDSVLLNQTFNNWQQWNTTVRRDLLDAIGRTPVGILALVDAVESEHLTANEIPSQARDAALKHRDPVVRERAQKLFPAIAVTDRSEVIGRYLPIVTQRGKSSNGAALFKQHCLTCHSMRGVGQRVGPDLAGISSRRRDVLLVDILDPSRQVTPDFVAYSVVTRQGRVLSGLLVAETADAITLRRERGEQDTILRSEIEELRGSNKSIMPDGFETKLSPEQMLDILEFLNQPDTKLLTAE